MQVHDGMLDAGCSVKVFYSRQERSLKDLKQMIAEKKNG